MNFRQATLADVAVLARMNKRLILDEGHRNPMSETQLAQRMAGWLQGEYEAMIFGLARVDVGYALYQQGADYLYLRQFWVDEGYRRQGIGRSALHWLKQNSWQEESRIRIEVLIGNDQAIAFWRSMGFRNYALTMELNNVD